MTTDRDHREVPETSPGGESCSVSVCVPVYNGERYLDACLESIAAQTARPEEVVLVNNASSDRSLLICQEFAERHPDLNVRIFSFQDLVDMGPNWNRTVELATGPLVKVVPCDDILEPEILERQRAVMQACPDLALVLCGKTVVNGRGKPRLRKGPRQVGRVAGPALAERALRSPSNPLGEPASGLFWKQGFHAVGGFREDMKYFVDVEFWIRLLHTGDAWLLREPLYRFRIHSAGASARSRKKAIDEFIQMNEIHRTLKASDKTLLLMKSTTIAWLRDLLIRCLG